MHGPVHGLDDFRRIFGFVIRTDAGPRPEPFPVFLDIKVVSAVLERGKLHVIPAFIVFRLDGDPFRVGLERHGDAGGHQGALELTFRESAVDERVDPVVGIGGVGTKFPDQIQVRSFRKIFPFLLENFLDEQRFVRRNLVNPQVDHLPDHFRIVHGPDIDAHAEVMGPLYVIGVLEENLLLEIDPVDPVRKHFLRCPVLRKGLNRKTGELRCNLLADVGAAGDEKGLLRSKEPELVQGGDGLVYQDVGQFRRKRDRSLELEDEAGERILGNAREEFVQGRKFLSIGEHFVLQFGVGASGYALPVDLPVVENDGNQVLGQFDIKLTAPQIVVHGFPERSLRILCSPGRLGLPKAPVGDNMDRIRLDGNLEKGYEESQGYQFLQNYFHQFVMLYGFIIRAPGLFAGRSRKIIGCRLRNRRRRSRLRLRWTCRRQDP